MDKQTLRRLVQVARGDIKAELVIKNAQVFHAELGEFLPGDIAIEGKRIAGIGSYEGEKEIDAAGRYALPGFIDAHVHIESSMLSPAEYARAVVPLGTTTIVADPHEIANVAGLNGLDYMSRAAEGLPLDIFYMLPSCVPATQLEDSGARLCASELAPYLERKNFIGLAEMMNYPGVLFGDEQVYDKLQMSERAVVDGHAPQLSGRGLQAYAAAGIRSDHECSTAEEARQRLAAGMYLQIREGTAARNLRELLPVVNSCTMPFCVFAVDDCHPAELLGEGDMNRILSRAVLQGLPAAWAINMATINPARCYGLRFRGQLAPHFRADVLLVDSLVDFRPSMVIKDGQPVAENGRLLVELPELHSESLEDTVHLPELSAADLALPCASGRAHIIGLVDRQIITEHLELEVPTVDGCAVADPAKDILKLAVFERHHGTGTRGLGLVKGYGLRRGAVAATVAHDSHNLIVIGANDADMLLAARTLAEVHGGLCVAADGEVKGVLPLEIGGLMSNACAKETAARLDEVLRAARELGIAESCDPFLTLAFLSLPVIPSLKLTNRGLVDVEQFKIIPVAVEEDAYADKE